MESFPTISERLARIPRMVKIGGLVVVLSLVAIFVFNLAVSTVIGYAFFALLCGSHLFMHGAHGAQPHQDHAPAGASTQGRPQMAASSGDHANHSKGCH